MLASEGFGTTKWISYDWKLKEKAWSSTPNHIPKLNFKRTNEMNSHDL